MGQLETRSKVNWKTGSGRKWMGSGDWDTADQEGSLTKKGKGSQAQKKTHVFYLVMYFFNNMLCITESTTMFVGSDDTTGVDTTLTGDTPPICIIGRFPSGIGIDG